RSLGPTRRIRRNLQRVGPRRPRIRPPPRSRLRAPTPHPRPPMDPPPPQKRPRRPLLGSPPRKPQTPRRENPSRRERVMADRLDLEQLRKTVKENGRCTCVPCVAARFLLSLLDEGGK